MCPNDDPASECVAGCLFAGSLAAECVPYFQDWLSCSIDTGVECTGDGLAEATSCYDEEELFSACIASLS
jgi:hypothetical protein